MQALANHAHQEGSTVAIGNEGANFAVNCIFVCNSFRSQLRQENFFYPVQWTFLEQFAFQQRASLNVFNLPHLVVLDVRAIQQAKSLHFPGRALSGASLDNVVVQRAEADTGCRSSQLLQHGFHLIEKRVVGQTFTRHAATNRELTPFFATYSPACRSNDFLNAISILLECLD
ncbi:hypothetical protein [Janthinobacterium lividum]|uniref:hypothetical protein n=1 Tax=Janthinobacterium lividum TaxID=29581 RepID=UPI003D2541D9